MTAGAPPIVTYRRLGTAYCPANQNLWLIYGWDNLLDVGRDVPGARLALDRSSRAGTCASSDHKDPGLPSTR